MAEPFKAYDIRGIYGETITEELYKEIGTQLNVLGDIKTLVIGCDMRHSSQALKHNVIEGAREIGINVIDIGMASTPMIYQASHDFDVELGIIITASHNPKEYNGMKLCRKNAIPIAMGSGIELLQDAIEDNKEVQEADTQGELEIVNSYKQEYLTKLKKYANHKKNLKIVLDCGNGIGGYADTTLLREMCNLHVLYEEPDGNFPNHEADPLKEENLKDLKKKVVENNAYMGIAFDGDADRVGFVDEKGTFVPADLMGAALIEHFINQFPDEQNYSYDLRSTKALNDIIVKAGKNPHKTRVGHSFIKENMRKYGSFFSVELSGHLYFKFEEDVVYDSSLRATIEVINTLSELDTPLSEIIKNYIQYVKSPEINFSVEDKESVIQNIKDHFNDATIEEIDGISINYDNWWCNIRASNTENKLRLNLEAENQELYNKKLEEIKSIITK